jgi:hypothetical protein
MSKTLAVETSFFRGIGAVKSDADRRRARPGPDGTSSHRRLVWIGTALLVAGCGSSSSSASAPSAAPASSTRAPSAAASPSSAICDDAAALRTSLQQLGQVKVGKGAASTLAPDMLNVKTNLTTLISSAGSEWTSQTGALKTAIDGLGTAVTSLRSQPSLSAVTTVQTALGGVTTAARNLNDAAKVRCGA